MSPRRYLEAHADIVASDVCAYSRAPHYVLIEGMLRVEAAEPPIEAVAYDAPSLSLRVL